MFVEGGAMRERCWHRHVRVGRLAVGRRVDGRWWRSLRRRLVVDAGAGKLVKVDLHVDARQFSFGSEQVERQGITDSP